MQSITLPRTEYQSLDDAALVDHARNNADAFAALYHRYLTPLYRYLYHRVGNEKDAEDLAAQVFTEVLEGLETYRERGRFASWLFTIARRRLVDLYRQRTPEPLDDPSDGAINLDDVLEQCESQERLAHLLTGLDEGQLELLRLRFSAGLKFSEIASVLGQSEGAVKMKLYRTLDWLRVMWENNYEK
jgi:RNA polymerase sigma factor (sigma-70 family)